MKLFVLALNLVIAVEFSQAAMSYQELRSIGQISREKVANFMNALPTNRSVLSGFSLTKGQDRTMAHTSENLELHGICDGHGGADDGHIAAEKISAKTGRAAIFPLLEKIYDEQFDSEGLNDVEKISAACLMANQGLIEGGEIGGAGTTLSAGFDKKGESKTLFFNVGDSPIVIVTTDGKVYSNILQDQFNQKEIERVIAAGYEFRDGRYQYAPYSMQPSRDFGVIAKQHPVAIPVPYVYEFPTDQIAFTLIVSDGLSDSWLLENRREGRLGIDAGFVEDLIDRSLGLTMKSWKGKLTNQDMNKVAKSYLRSHNDDMSFVVKKYLPPSQEADNQKEQKNKQQKYWKYGLAGVGVITVGIVAVSLFIYKDKINGPRHKTVSRPSALKQH
jgi:serine/threonine protein phosphatase PrpC